MNSRDYEMAFTPKEFKKTLFGQFSTHSSYSITTLADDAWLLEGNNHGEKAAEPEPLQIKLRITEGEPRILFLLSLAVLHVHFDFVQASAEQQQSFLQTFFRYFHKGGG